MSPPPATIRINPNSDSNPYWNASCTDCDGDLNGTAVEDDCGDWDGDGYPCCTVEVDIACPDGDGTFDGYSGPHEEYPWPSNGSTQWIPVENGGMGDIPTVAGQV